jgi:hypothetical protein
LFCRHVLDGSRFDGLFLGNWLFDWCKVVTEQILWGPRLHGLFHGDHIVKEVIISSAGLRELVIRRKIGRRSSWRRRRERCGSGGKGVL